MNGTHRFVHGLVVVTLGMAALLAIAVGSVSLAIAKFIPGEPALPSAWIGVPIAFVPTVIAACSFAIARRLRWRWLALAALPISTALAFLANDDSESPPIPDLGPRVGIDDPGYQRLMWFSEKSPHTRLHKTGAPTPAADRIRLPKEQADWAQYVAEKRSDLEQAVAANTLGQEWIAELEQRPPAGICPLFDQNFILAYRSVRNTAEPLLALAYARALDGDPDEAVHMVLPLLCAMHNLQRTSANLVHAMIANVVLKRCYTVLGATLQLGRVTENTRRQLAQALEAAPPIRQVFRNAFLGEADFIHLVFARMRHGDYSDPFALDPALNQGLMQSLRFCGPFGLHPNRTERQVQSVYAQMCATAESRDTAALKEWLPNWGEESQLRNPAGRLLAAMAIPAFEKPTREFWRAEDSRRSLLNECAVAATTSRAN